MRKDKAEQILEKLYKLKGNQKADEQQFSLGLDDMRPREGSKKENR